ncbi:BamA/TamA family outer membrane protein [Candidatus Poribacteria bacterium]|nr:BamA/TamA family outer membrane protein [Candidatus Poribacteria bacterium]
MLIKKHKYFIILFIAIIFITTSFHGYCQSFGKNKVSRSNFKWLTYKTTHFTIYYYPDEESLVRTMADAAEIAYAKISSVLEHELSKNTPLVLYKSHGDFQQTNIILETLSEGVGGFAELLKYRVVIPFSGSISEFQKVIAHEINHIFQYDIFYKDLLAHIYTGEFLRSPPLWFIEGTSEYMSDHWDAEGRMVLRDAVINNSIVPLKYLQDFSPLGSRVYLGYKQGHSAVEYLVNTYGIDKLPEIMRELGISKSKDLDRALQNSIGITLEEFDEEWQRYVKKTYWPRVAEKQIPGTMGTGLTSEDKNAFYNVKPTWSPSGDLIAYITYDTGYEEIKLVSSKDGKEFSKVTDSLSGNEYEFIREKGSGLTWSPKGDKIAFIAGKNGKDYLIILNIVSKYIVSKITMPFDAAYSPAWSPDGKSILIVGLYNGRSDIYMVNMDNNEIDQVTDDVYDDNGPSWHPFENKIIYSSERNGRYKLFSMEMNSKDIQQITFGSQNDVSPSWSKDGKHIVFTSDMNGIYDVYNITSEGKNLTRLTNILTGCFNPVYDPDSEKIAMTVYYEGRNDIYILRPKEFLNEKVPIPSQHEPDKPLYVVDDRGVKGVDYSLNFSPDLIYIDFGYVSGGTFQNSVQFIGSDIMGDHRLSAGLDFVSFINQPEFLLAYYYLKKRADVGGAVYNWSDYYIEGEDEYWQRTTGIAGFLSYPLDQYRRIDLQLERSLRFFNYVNLEEKRKAKDSITALSLSYVKDVAIWSSFGPYIGSRYNLSLEQALKLTDRDLKMTNVIGDYRKYFKLGQRSNFSLRFLGAASLGQDKEKFYLGSSFRQSQSAFYFNRTLMRGYEYYEISGNRVGLLNLEFRIPFVDELRFGWPFSWGIGGIRGVIFMDFAGVWPRPEGATDIYGDPIDYEQQFKPWVIDNGKITLKDLRSSIGLGFRIGSGSLAFSFDFAKKTDLRRLGEGYEFHFGIGPEF